MTEKETLLAVGGVAVAWLLLRKKTAAPVNQGALAAQQLAAQQLAAAQAQQTARGTTASQAGAIAAGIGQGLGSLLKGIGALTGGGSGTNKENGGTYSTESTAVVDEYEAMPETLPDNGYDDSSYGVD